MQSFISLIVGVTFALGLAVSGMTQPQKIISFLNLQQWDYSLLFVMVGAIGVHLLFYRLIKKLKSPLLEKVWHVPKRTDITPRLVMGSFLFGIGWAIGGFCPGPAIVSVVTGDTRVYVFVGAMLIGMVLFKYTEKYIKMRG